MNIRKTAVNCCLLLVLCIIGGGILITLANYLPINEKQKNASLEEIASEGLFPEIPSMEGGYGNFHSMNPTTLELATDSLMLKMALYDDEYKGIWQAFLCYSTQYQEEYSRYWHGYVVILRALLLFFDYYEIRILNGIFQSLLVFMAAYFILKQKGKKYALAIISSYILLMPMALAQCLQYSWVFYVTFGALLIYLRHRDYWEKGNRYIYFFMFTGAATIYLDLLTYPLLTWGIPITWWLLLQEREEKVIDYLKKLVCSGLSWIAGYGGMWVGKWALGSIVLRQNLFAKAFSEALLWTVDENDSSITIQERFYAVFRNWSTYAYKLFLILLAAWLLYWILKGFLSGYSKSPRAPALLLLFSSSIVWYLVLAGHANMHHIFTHKIFGVSIAAFFGMILLSTENKSSSRPGRKYLLEYSAVLIGISALSFFLMRQMKDEFSLDNGSTGFMKVEVPESASMVFRPSFSEITSLHVGFSVENGTKGYCLIELFDEDTLLEQIMLPFDSYSNGNFHEVPVNWELEAGHPYTLSLTPIENDGSVYLWVTADNVLPLTELQETQIGEQPLGGQMLIGISYLCILVDLSMRLLYIATFAGIGIMAVYTGWSLTAFYP